MTDALRAAIEGGRLHHAYLFEGPAGSGKAAAARELAMRLECETRVGCGQCIPCSKVAAGTHPDVFWFDMTPKGLTERVRELLTTLGFRPHEGRARVVVFESGARAGAGARARRGGQRALEDARGAAGRHLLHPRHCRAATPAGDGAVTLSAHPLRAGAGIGRRARVARWRRARAGGQVGRRRCSRRSAGWRPIATKPSS